MPRDNEGRCCDAVVRVLETHLGTKRSDLHIPDKIDRMRKKQRVDACLSIGRNRYVLEHTRVEPFSEAIGAGVRVADLIRGVQERLRACAPLPGPAIYELKLPKDPRLGGGSNTREQHARIKLEMAAWAHSESTDLHLRAVEAGRQACIGREFSGLLVHLVCTAMGAPSETTPGEFGGVRDVPESLEDSRVVRLRKALGDKCPKLLACKVRGARTVLVLENDDIALSDHLSIREALERAAEDRDDLADEVYLVNTGVDDNCWYVFPVNPDADARLGRSPSRDGYALPQTFRFSELEDLTEAGDGANEGCRFCIDG